MNKSIHELVSVNILYYTDVPQFDSPGYLVICLSITRQSSLTFPKLGKLVPNTKGFNLIFLEKWCMDCVDFCNKSSKDYNNSYSKRVMSGSF